MMKNYYSILGVSKNATSAEIKNTYREKAKQFHPDVNQTSYASQRMTEINEAYKILNDPISKAEYDKQQTTHQSASSSTAQAQGKKTFTINPGWVMVLIFVAIVWGLSHSSNSSPKSSYSNATSSAQPIETLLPGVGTVNISCVQQALTSTELQKIVQAGDASTLTAGEKAKIDNCVVKSEDNSPTPSPANFYNYEQPSPSPTSYYHNRNSYDPPSPPPTPDGLQGQVHCNSNYAGGYNCTDSNGDRATLNPNYAGGYRGQDSYGNQINLNPNYAGGYRGTNGNNSINCQPNYANGFNCN